MARSGFGSNPLRRVARVLDFVALAARGVPLVEIAHAVELPPSTVHRLVNSLLDIGYLSTDADTKVYSTGPRLNRLFQLSIGRVSLASIADPILEDISEEFNEVSFVGRLTDRRIDVVAIRLPKSSDRAFVHPGHNLPLHATSTGKVILAHQSKEYIEAALANPLKKFQPDTIVSKKQMLAELARVRERGFAVHDAEYDPGVYAVATPVAWPRPNVIFAMAVVGFKQRILREFNEAQIVESLTRASDRLANTLSRGEYDAEASALPPRRGRGRAVGSTGNGSRRLMPS